MDLAIDVIIDTEVSGKIKPVDTRQWGISYRIRDLLKVQSINVNPDSDNEKER